MTNKLLGTLQHLYAIRICPVFVLLHGLAFLTLTLSFLSFECFYFPKLKSNIFLLYGLRRSSPQNNWMRSKILETMLMCSLVEDIQRFFLIPL